MSTHARPHVLTCIRVHLHVRCVHVCGCTCLYTTVYLHGALCVCVSSCTCVSVCTCPCVRGCVCTHACACICTLWLCARARVLGDVARREPRARAQILPLQAGSFQLAQQPLGAQPSSSLRPGQHAAHRGWAGRQKMHTDTSAPGPLGRLTVLRLAGVGGHSPDATARTAQDSGGLSTPR